MRILVLWLFLALPAYGKGEKAGAFDYYVLSLGWSSTWCVLTGDARRDDQCDARHDYTFTLHGLWPQNEQGWPSYCRTTVRDPSRRETAAMTDVMGSGGLAWYQWKKHGRCAGISADDYFAASRQAYENVTIPSVFSKIQKDLKIDARVIEDAFLEANPAMSADMITITCDQGMIQEARICLTKDLQLRSCGKDTIRDCKLTNALLPAVR
jgi:ribonuclease T2